MKPKTVLILTAVCVVVFVALIYAKEFKGKSLTEGANSFQSEKVIAEKKAEEEKILKAKQKEEERIQREAEKLAEQQAEEEAKQNAIALQESKEEQSKANIKVYQYDYKDVYRFRHEDDTEFDDSTTATLTEQQLYLYHSLLVVDGDYTFYLQYPVSNLDYPPYKYEDNVTYKIVEYEEYDSKLILTTQSAYVNINNNGNYYAPNVKLDIRFTEGYFNEAIVKVGNDNLGSLYSGSMNVEVPQRLVESTVNNPLIIAVEEGDRTLTDIVLQNIYLDTPKIESMKLAR